MSGIGQPTPAGADPCSFYMRVSIPFASRTLLIMSQGTTVGVVNTIFITSRILLLPERRDLCRLKLEVCQFFWCGSGRNAEKLNSHDTIIGVKIQDDSRADFFRLNDLSLIQPEVEGITVFPVVLVGVIHHFLSSNNILYWFGRLA